MKKILFMMSALLLSSMPVAAYSKDQTEAGANTQDVVGRASVVDGDTLDVRGVRIRLMGIDAPESGQWCLNQNNFGYPCGKDVAFWLSSWLETKNVSCVPSGRVTHGRIVAECFVDGVSVNDTLVSNGMATAEARHSRKFLVSEEKAIRQKRGMWSGRFDRPSQYRRGVNEVSSFAKSNIDPVLKNK